MPNDPHPADATVDNPRERLRDLCWRLRRHEMGTSAAVCSIGTELELAEANARLFPSARARRVLAQIRAEGAEAAELPTGASFVTAFPGAGRRPC